MRQNGTTAGFVLLAWLLLGHANADRFASRTLTVLNDGGKSLVPRDALGIALTKRSFAIDSTAETDSSATAAASSTSSANDGSSASVSGMAETDSSTDATHAGVTATSAAATGATSATPGMREVCTNTCRKANNGVCEEGRPGKAAVTSPYLMVYCDLGTDCDDCGPWKTSADKVPWEDPSVAGPIRFLQSKDVQVRVRGAALPPQQAFQFAYTDPKSDYDVSYHVEGTGLVEAGITTIAYKLLNGRCIKADGSKELFVDVGANFGWFALLAAKLGCKVIAYEPVPVFKAFFDYSTYLNDLQHLIDIRPLVVSAQSGAPLKMVVPAKGIWGTAGIDGLNIDKAIQSDEETIEVPSVRLEDEVKSDVLLLKVDVEGYEFAVMTGAAQLLKNFNVETIIMEYSPGVAERHFRWDQMAATPAMLADLVQGGYRIGHIGDAGKHHTGGWESELPEFREVTMDNLKYDIEDVKKWKGETMACPIPTELRKFPMWALCGGVPEGLSPRSFRSEIGHNTNIWASKGDALKILRLSGGSGILDPKDPPTKYFQTNPWGFGMGSRPCVFLDAAVQVKHRCNCTKWDVCGEEHTLAEKLSLEGKIAQNYVLP